MVLQNFFSFSFSFRKNKFCTGDKNNKSLKVQLFACVVLIFFGLFYVDTIKGQKHVKK